VFRIPQGKRDQGAVRALSRSVEVIAMCSNPSRALARVLRPENTTSDQDVSESVWMETPPRPGRHTKTHLGPEQVEALVAGYQAGRTIRQLAAELGTHRSTVSGILRREGVTLRLQRIGQNDIELVIRLYQEGLSLLRISERIQKSPGTIRSELLRQGVPMRDSHGRAQP